MHEHDASTPIWANTIYDQYERCCSHAADVRDRDGHICSEEGWETKWTLNYSCLWGWFFLIFFFGLGTKWNCSQNILVFFSKLICELVLFHTRKKEEKIPNIIPISRIQMVFSGSYTHFKNDLTPECKIKNIFLRMCGVF